MDNESKTPSSGMDKIKKRLLRTKTIISQSSIDEESATNEGSELKRVLTTLDLTSLGVGSCCGTGMYVVAGLVAKNVAGPGVIISFAIAALASVFSGVCYAEFGVRVPKTSGSAYMYSYVTVGEFVAFLIGWNLILEYMIGSAAGASALSACFDALTNHSMSAYLEENVGVVIGKSYPDFLGFFIGLAMTAILAAGVQKSVRFNNILNAINILVWVFIMIAGIVYMDGDNWKVEGFAPYGASGIFSGAATCFYAFIGFDIIATTGEEARNPSRSIPRAILSTLLLSLLAYISVSLVLTLVIPYYDIHGDSALVDMFPQRGFNAGKYVVAVGAVSALTVSLLGSMFPMPRVIYAMSRDGLLFGFLSTIYEKTGTPVVATIVTGTLASLMALLVGLQILVEMMSIGTLLAYTLVSLSVLILRYQPTKEDLEIPIPMAHRLDAIEESPEGTEQDDVFDKDPLTKRRIKDDAQLIPSDGPEKKTYGSLPINSELVDSKLAMVKRHGKIWWLRLGFPSDDCIPNERTARTSIIFTGVLSVVSIGFGMVVVFGNDSLIQGDVWAYLLALVFFLGVCACLVIIMRQPQNKKKLQFMVPGVPVIPALALLFNVYLMLKLPALTWARLGVWIALGMVLYFGYSMTHSAKERKQKRKEEEHHPDKGTDQQQTIVDDAFTRLPEDEGVTFEKLPETIPNGTKPFVPPGGPPSNGDVHSRERPVQPDPETDRAPDRIRSRHKSGSVRFGQSDPDDTREDKHQSRNKPVNEAGNPFVNPEQSEVDQNYAINQPGEHQYHGHSAPEADLYQPRRAAYNTRNVDGEGDPFKVDEKHSRHGMKHGPDKSIARPRPRPSRPQANPFGSSMEEGDPRQGNPFRDGAW